MNFTWLIFTWSSVILISSCHAGTVVNKHAVTDDIIKVDCHPDSKDISQDSCTKRGCTWDDTGNEPRCYFPTDYGYTVSSQKDTDNGMNVVLQRKSDQASVFGGDIDTVNIDITYDTENRLRIKMNDPNNQRFEVPIDINSGVRTVKENHYSVEVITDPVFALVVTRKETGSVMFDSRVPGFTFSDQFLQISTIPPTSHVYGIGEQRHQRFSHDMNWKRWSLFGRDQGPNSEVQTYGAHPFFVQLEEDGQATGVFILNSNAMEYVMAPYPSVTMRSIGGILDIFIYMGPTIDDVVKQHLDTVGRPTVPPYWGLGFQLSRYGYNSIDNMKAAMQRTWDNNIPYDVQYTDIDTMRDKLDFTYDTNNFNGLPDLLQQAHDKGLHYVPILDPAIGNTATDYSALTDGLAQDVFIKYEDNTLLEGTVWPGTSYFPDFSADKTVSWWTDQLTEFHKTIPFDGIWTDMNEPANFAQGSTSGCKQNSYNFPPYGANIGGSQGDQRIFDKTICTDAVQEKGRHYDLHNMYGHFESRATSTALQKIFPGKRPMILTRSNYVSTGSHAPAHWLGDNQSDYQSMRDSIPTILEFNIFGIPFTGSDICGFNNNANADLCLRWMQLGAFYPFCRNHNTINTQDQDPGAMGDAVVAASVKALTERYRLLPYLYTLLMENHLGKIGTVARSLVQEFPTDAGTYDISFQFMWGPGLLISPAVYENQDTVDAYIPNEVWYDYYTGERMTTTGTTVTLSAPTDGNVPLHIRAGYILPRQQPGLTTTDSRKNPMGLLVALDVAGEATGSLVWDDGESLITDSSYDSYSYKMAQNILTITVELDGSHAEGLTYADVTFYGCDSAPTSVSCDGSTLPSSQVSYDATNKVLKLTELSLAVNTAHTIQLN